MNPPPDTKNLSLPLDTDDLKVLQDTEIQTTRTSSAMSVTSKGITKVTTQGFRRRIPKRSSSRKRRKASWILGMIRTPLKLTQSDDERANIALMANVLEESEASGSDSESDTEEVFPNFTINFTKAELA